MIAAGLTLIRGFITHGCSQLISGKLASFEDWDKWVRRSVLFASDVKPGMFGDVMDVVKANQAVDPEQESLINLLRALHLNFTSSPFHTADVIQKIKLPSAFADKSELELSEAVDGLPLRDVNKLNAKSLGRYFANRKDRWAGGFCLQAGRKIEDKQSWVVVKAAV
jgi:hypothetical protein